MATKIKTVESAFSATGRDIALLEVFNSLPEQDRVYMAAIYKRMVVTEAKNTEANNGKKWTPDYANGKWDKYYPYVWAKKNSAGVGFVVRDAGCASAHSYASCGSRLCFQSAELVEEFNSDFP